MQQQQAENLINSMAKTLVRRNRLADLKQYGLTEQNHIARYKRKLANNQLAQT